MSNSSMSPNIKSMKRWFRAYIALSACGVLLLLAMVFYDDTFFDSWHFWAWFFTYFVTTTTALEMSKWHRNRIWGDPPEF